MKWVVTYDVAEDDVRARIAKTLAGFGQRVQDSVFECVLSDERALERLLHTLGRELADDPKGQIRLYRVCGDCIRESRGLGAVVRTMDSDVCVIL